MAEATAFDVLVVGAGPAGIAAACTAAECGARVGLIEEGFAEGGQVWRGERAAPKTSQSADWFARLARSGALKMPETRIVAICNLQDEGRTCEDALRPDLYYRLAALKITAPPLRNRGEDILTLFTALADQFADEYGCDAPQVSAQEAAQLLQAPWPGNVRQLINLAERAVLQSRRGTGTIASLLMSDHDEMQPVMTTEGKPLKEYVEAFERMLIDNTMRRHRGSIASVMDELCLPRRTLNEKMAKYGLQRQDYV